MYKQKTITCLLIFLILSLYGRAQDAVDIKSITKEINKTDKSLATEFAAIKFIPDRTFTAQEAEGYESLNPTSAFYISAYEVTNKQYRQFVDYVQDSILRKLFGYVKQDKEGYEFIDYTKKINARQVIERMHFNPGQKPYYFDAAGSIRLNARYIVYAYKVSGKRVNIPVMPDTTLPGKDHFFLPYFDNYPVTGIDSQQAQAYCHWKTEQLKTAIANNEKYDISVFTATDPQRESALASGQLGNNLNGGNEATGFRYVVSFKRKAGL